MNDQKPEPIPEEVLEDVAEAAPVAEIITLEQLQNAENKAMRALADLENYKRREAAAKAMWGEMAVVMALKPILPSLVALQTGADHSADETLKTTISKLMEALNKGGLQAIAPEADTPVNADEHHVLLRAEGTPGCVVQVLEPGWKWNERVIEPAKVSACAEE